MSSTELPSVPASNVLPKVAPVRVAEGERLRSVGLPGITLTVRSRPPAREGLPPALYVHGLGGSSQNWSALMQELEGVVDGEAVDLPGFGDSPPPDDGDYSVTGHARAVIRYLDSAGRGPVHLFGNSLGGAVSTRVAALRPDLVRTLTLVSPALPELLVQRSAVPTALLALPGVAGLFTRYTKEWTAEQRVRGVLMLCYGDPGRVTPEGFRNAVEEMERRLRLTYFWDAMTRSARGIVNAYTLGGQHGLWRQAERVLAPTLLVYGGRDQLVGFRMARRAARAFRDSRLLTLPEAGHVAMMEYPETVARAFVELLADKGELPDGVTVGPVRPGAARTPDTVAAAGDGAGGGAKRTAAADADGRGAATGGTTPAEAGGSGDGGAVVAGDGESGAESAGS
ncbi:alpha/beta fold hydrolase [Streptomyces griseorubiginosus]|uniref:alpha/beta fold hydrolase n=1 Tax=Streptomyces griseorubiginosus TaxID=67304 RepID=UPI001AD7D5A5|nr:alpha/beta hydrolase [Streptomyces griseorubiginosus]MBO4255364.1 alpha/beta fold hydrolase [Streptomyces griseorubiginosus]